MSLDLDDKWEKLCQAMGQPTTTTTLHLITSIGSVLLMRQDALNGGEGKVTEGQMKEFVIALNKFFSTKGP